MGSIGLERFSLSPARVKPMPYVPNRASAPSSQLPAPGWFFCFSLGKTPSQALAVSGMVDSIVHYRMDEMGEKGGYVVQLVSHYKGL
ncbi:hypothetical protein N7485_010023 [Penicillium canescens]|nr:hypothetical protein N7485_010023 [Penicillium canescens]